MNGIQHEKTLPAHFSGIDSTASYRSIASLYESVPPKLYGGS